jgi:hypothetical protein
VFRLQSSQVGPKVKVGKSASFVKHSKQHNDRLVIQVKYIIKETWRGKHENYVCIRRDC